MRYLQIGSFYDMTFLMVSESFVVMLLIRRYCYVGDPNFYFPTSNNLKINDN